MDHETLEVLRLLPYYNSNVTTDEYSITKLLGNNATVYIYGNKLKILPENGGMLIIDIKDVAGDIAPFSD